MGERSEIQFCTATWNPWQGCIKVSPGCKFCYMYREKNHYGQDPTDVHRSAHSTFHLPLRLQRAGRREIIFTCSWSDWFIEQADPWRADAWKIIRDTPEHFYLIFTKRSERIPSCLPADWGTGYPNVMLVATAENQEMADKRASELVQVPAEWRGLSLEPLLGAVDVSRYLKMVWGRMDNSGAISSRPALNWLVIGGESGNDIGYYRYRPAHVRWFQNLVEQGVAAGTPVFMKQMGTHIAKAYGLKDRSGGDMSEWIWQDLKIRQHIPYVTENFKHHLEENYATKSK
jgi:protein gp37